MKPNKKLLKKLEYLKFQLGFACHKQADMFPHPHWWDEETRLIKEIKEVEQELKAKSDE